MKRLLDRGLSAEDLREHTDRVATPLDQAEQAVISLVIMRLGAEYLALAARDVIRVEAKVPVHRVPHRTNDVIRGLCNIDGALVLTAALDQLLGISADERPPGDHDLATGRMVVIGDPAEPWAFAVDAVPGVGRFEVATFRKLPMTVERSLVHYAEAIVPIEDRHASVLDSRRIIAGLQGVLA